MCMCPLQLTQELLLSGLLSQQQHQASSASVGQPTGSAGAPAAVGQHMGGPGATSSVLHQGPGGYGMLDCRTGLARLLLGLGT
jgi:hypothetical protein